MRAVGNIAVGTYEQTEHLLDCGLLQHLPFLLAHENLNMRRDAVWLLSNITAESEKQIQHLIDSDLIPSVVEFLTEVVI